MKMGSKLLLALIMIVVLLAVGALAKD